MTYRLALDLGSTSLGWCLFETDDGEPRRIRDIGVRIFSDGRDEQKKEPLAVSRRKARGMRRNLDRRGLRRKQLIACLVRAGLMPEDEKERKELERLDPYELRAKALDEKLPPYHLGRALFHINQRRGFKSNRKADKKEKETGAMKKAIKDLAERMEQTGSRTLGEYLYKLHKDKKPVRARPLKAQGGKSEYVLYPSREMYEAEIRTILEAQKKHHPFLTPELCEEIEDIILFQRPLKPAEPGNCVFENGEKRARKALPVFQKFRILQEVNNLEIERLSQDDPVLGPEERQKIIEALLSGKKKTFSQIRALLGLNRDVRFNLESDSRKELLGDETSAQLSDEKSFGPEWRNFPPERQEEIVNLLCQEPDPEKLARELMEKYGLDREKAEYTANEVSLPDGYCSVSKKAILNMLPWLERGNRYADAARNAGYHHSDFRTGEVFDRLPYYGEILQSNVIGGSYDEADREFPEKFYGKVNNPSVHIALNQVRKLVNGILETYGKPDEIVIEMARDLKEPADDLKKEQAKNKKENDRINKELEKLGVKQNYRNRMLFKLWEDLAKEPEKRCCPFSGKQISVTDIFSGEFEEEHLLPFSRSFNNSRANKVLSHIAWNRKKGNRSPFEAFGHEPYWNEILARVQNLPKNKQWRFMKDAWEKMEGKDGVIARMLNDTRYMARLARQYLAAVFDNEKGKSKVWTTTGQMTALLREKLGLNSLLGEDDDAKERRDHRHHAIDAFVIGLIDRGMIKKVSDAAKRVETTPELWEKRRKLVAGMPDPYEGFRDELKERIGKIVVSHKPDHGDARRAINAKRPYTVGPLHEQTAYGFISEGKKKGMVKLAVRVPVESLEKTKHISEVADPVIREKLSAAVQGLKEKSEEWKQALADFTRKTGTRRVRVHSESGADTLVGISSPKQKKNPYKYYATGGNYCAEIFSPKRGKKAGKWLCEVITNFDAHRKDFIPNWRKEHPEARLVMRLQINDMVAYEQDGKTVIARVKKIAKTKNGKIYLRPHTIAKEEGDKESWGASSNQLMLKNARKISVDILGRVKDPAAMRAKAAV